MYDLVVLGGGPAGLTVAKLAARAGARVALVEKAKLGGECTHVACVPSKALLEAARRAHEIQTAATYGIHVPAPTIDFAAVMGRIRAVVAEFAGSGTGDSLRALGIDLYTGTASFEAYDTLLIDGQTRINAQRFVIATGSRPAMPPIPGLAEAWPLDERSVWDLNSLPGELVVIGAGPSGIEFAQAFARLGSRVTVVADSRGILPAEDHEVSDGAQALLEAEGIQFRTNVEVVSVTLREGRKVCTLKDRSSGATSEVSGTYLLVAAGRLANVDGLNLDAVGVHADPEHGIEVDEYLQTRSSRILALGDVLQKHQFTHCAERQAEVVFQNAVLRLPRKLHYDALPWATFIDPEVATVGLSETDARAQHPEVLVFRTELSEIDRARIDGRTQGFAKVVAVPSGKILGATMLGPEAALVIQEFALAIENGLSLVNIAETFHTYPTYAGIARKLANQFVARRLESSLVHKAVRWFHGYLGRNAEGAAPAATASAAAGHAPAGSHPNGHEQGHQHAHSH